MATLNQERVRSSYWPEKACTELFPSACCHAKRLIDTYVATRDDKVSPHIKSEARLAMPVFSRLAVLLRKESHTAQPECAAGMVRQ